MTEAMSTAQVIKCLGGDAPIGSMLVRRLQELSSVDFLHVRQTRGLGYQIDHVHAESVASAVEPEAHNIPNCLPYFWVVPIQVRLLGDVEAQIILLSLFRPGPSRLVSED